MRIFEFDEMYEEIATWCGKQHHPDKWCRDCWSVFDFAECLLEGTDDADYEDA